MRLSGQSAVAPRFRSARGRAGGSLLALAALLWGLAGFTPQAGAQSCPGRDRPVEVTLDAPFEPARVNHSLPIERIDALFRQTNGDATVRGAERAVGLTRTSSEFRFETRTEAFQRADGRFCVYLRRLDARLAQVDTTIYVAREYPRDSCNYSVIYEHEKIHVGIYYFTHQDYAERLQALLRRLVQGVNPRIVNTRAEARRAHAQAIEAGVAGLLDAMEAERKRKNAALDSPQNYARERAKCPSW